MAGTVSPASPLRDVAAQDRPQDPPAAVPPRERPDPAVERLIRQSLPSDARLEIARDETTGVFIYRAIDPATGAVIKQWPPENLLRLKDYLRQLEGLLFDARV